MMDTDRYQRAKAIFFEACERPRDDREAYVQNQCADDVPLCAAVMELLLHDNDPLTLMNSSALREHLERLADSANGDASGDGAEDGAKSATPLPQHIGRYRILDLLGEGGMGVVYRAEQENPRRQVALKVIARGQASRQMLRRFEHEAQILGRLHHPGIAQIYEAGMHDAGDGGRPYFAMELVRGRPLLEFSNKNRVDRRGRLELFISICEAVQHAHQQGVVHRDLKPANILVQQDAGGRRK
jgi:predicted Ser/Thr protein kinase